jgi:hypothetical protein
MKSRTRTTSAALAIIPLLAWLPSCNTPDSVARFCSSAVVTLRSGDSLFDDMKASCIRETQTREALGTFAVANGPTPAPCEDIGRQADGLKAASGLLSSYFTALNDLASFGATKTGDTAKDLLTKVSTQAKLSPARRDALGSIVGVLTRVGTAGYRQKQLANDIVKVHEDVKTALDGLGEAVGVVYLHELQQEETKTATRYKEFLAEHPGAPDAMLILDSRWQTDSASFAAKEKAALCFKAALDTLAKGNQDLAAHARKLKAKELAGLLSPYAAQLESLAPTIQKAFF